MAHFAINKPTRESFSWNINLPTDLLIKPNLGNILLVNKELNFISSGFDFFQNFIPLSGNVEHLFIKINFSENECREEVQKIKNR